MTDYEVNEAAMRDGDPACSGPDPRTCGGCAHWHEGTDGAGVCDLDLDRLVAQAEVLKLACTSADTPACSGWEEWE